MSIYAHYVDPKKYPAFDKRQHHVVTQETLGDEIQFTSSRYIKHTLDYKQLLEIDETLKQYTEDYDIGKCFWLNWTTKLADNVDELIRKLAEKNLYLHGFWGLAPGIREDPSIRDYGYFAIPEELHQLLQAELGDHFLGYDIGETDGWYIGGYVSREDNAAGPKTRLGQYKAFEAYFEEIAHHFYDKMTILCALTTIHYFAREGYAMLLSCESAQSLPNPQMWYGFLRGASKQYGILCGGNVSVWNRWGYKTYESSGGTPPTARGAEIGTSLSLLKRLLYCEYMYNCEVLGFEQTWFTDDNEEMYRKKLPSSTENVPIYGKLSPLGHINQYANRLFKRIGRPGVMYTPVAIIADAFCGWLPPRHLYTRKLYQAWGNIPYGTGDWQMNALFELLYPGYADAGFYLDERGFLARTPYGEIADVLLSDVDRAVLSRYSMALLVSGTTLTYELYDKLQAFTAGGGHVVLFADTVQQAAEKLAKYDEKCTEFFGVKAFTGKTVAGGHTLLTADLGDVQVEAAIDGVPAIVTRDTGAGQVTLILAQDGLQVKDTAKDITNTVEQSVVMPYDFADFIKTYLDRCLTPYSLVKTSNGELQHIVTVKDEHTLRLLVVNNTYTAQAYDIESAVGGISVEEISLEDGSREMVGFYPDGLTADNDTVGGSGSRVIPALGVQLFEITLADALSLAQESYPARQQRKTGVRMPADCPSIKDFLLETPSFDQYFDCVLVDGEYFERADKAQIEKDAAYLKLKDIKVSLDLTSLSNHFPGLAFEDAYPERREESYARLDAILDKFFCFHTESVFVTLIRSGAGTVDELKASLQKYWAYVVRRCEPHGTHVVFQNRPILFKTESMYNLAEAVPGVEMALHVGAALCAEADCDAVLSERDVKHLLLSAPVVDVLGQRYNSALPVAGSGFEAENVALVQKAAEATVYLGGTYADWDDIYADYKLVFGA